MGGRLHATARPNEPGAGHPNSNLTEQLAERLRAVIYGWFAAGHVVTATSDSDPHPCGWDFRRHK